MKKQAKKLVLTKETVLSWEGDKLRAIKGGYMDSFECPPPPSGEPCVP
jgi:hypothetical protein